MVSLTEEELRKIIAWQPYRKDWPVNRNLVAPDDGIQAYFGDLMDFFENNPAFNSYFSNEDGGISNYFEIFCYPKDILDDQKAILFCVSLCAPLAAYGEVPFSKKPDSVSWGWLVPEKTGIIHLEKLKMIESLVLPALAKKGIIILSAAELSEVMHPDIYVEDLHMNSLHEGNQLLHAIFQVMD